MCVFCSSKESVVPRFKKDVEAVADLLISQKDDLVYGGGSEGLMGLVANRILEGGGRVIGVFPKGYFPNEVQHQGLSEMILTDSYVERKKKLREISDVFLALPGGFGTLDELLEVITLKSVGEELGPLILYGPKGFWSPLDQLIRSLDKNGMLYPEALKGYSIIENPSQLKEVFDDL